MWGTHDKIIGWIIKGTEKTQWVQNFLKIHALFFLKLKMVKVCNF